MLKIFHSGEHIHVSLNIPPDQITNKTTITSSNRDQKCVCVHVLHIYTRYTCNRTTHPQSEFNYELGLQVSNNFSYLLLPCIALITTTCDFVMRLFVNCLIIFCGHLHFWQGSHKNSKRKIEHKNVQFYCALPYDPSYTELSQHLILFSIYKKLLLYLICAVIL